MFKKYFSLLLCLTLMLCASLAAAEYTPGTYEGTAAGFGGDITAKVTVTENEIVSIDFAEHKETVGVSDPAFAKLPDAIIEAQSVGVDTVSGCTFSSQGILNAVKAALLAAGADETEITKKVEAAPSEPKETLEYTADVVIIGAGGAGMSAALEAKQAGADVIVLEKTASVGGNTIVAGSALNCADPENQKKLTMSASELATIRAMAALEPKDDYMAKWQAQINADLDAYEAAGETYLYDSPSLHALQTYVDGDYVGNPELIEILANNALSSVQFLSELGAKWQPTITAAVGATWTRSHTPTQDFGSAGASFVLPQTKAYEALGGQIIFEHRASELIKDGNRVIGVKGETTDGTPFIAHANKGVVICTGGFGANVEMRQKYNKHWANLDETVETTNVSTATGDGIVMAENAGVNLVGMEWIQMLPTGKIAFGPTINNTIFVNNRGERFVKEDGRRDELSAAVLEQPGSYYYKIVDAHTAEDELGGVTYKGLIIEDIVDGQYCINGDTVEDLANQLGMDPAVLQASIDEFNEAVESGTDRFGRAVFDQKLDKGPFYALHGVAKVHHTMGGIEINGKTQAIGVDGNVVEGLYAAGEVTGGIHGANRLGGNAIADVVTFGRIAGQEVVK